MIKVHIDEHTLYITDDVYSFNIDTLKKKRVITYRYSSTPKLIEIINALPQYDIKNHIIYHSEPNHVLNELSQVYEKIDAAGGLVLNEKGDILFIYRNSKWDLPKGKTEPNESMELTAIREVEEECGLKITMLNQHLVTTYHTYTIGKKKILKTNRWYLMTANSHHILTPQIDENIEKAEWKNLSEIPELLKTSYDSIKDVIAKYLSLVEADK